MRKLLRFLARPIVWSTGGLLLLLLALYVVCGLVGLDEKRLYVELVVGIPLVLFLVVYWLRELWVEWRLARELQAQARKQAKDAGPDALCDLQVLDQEFSCAFHELNQVCRERGIVGGAAALPWILVMGLPGVGKSMVLECAGLCFTSLGRRVQG